MLTRAANPSRNDTESQDESQGNSLAAGIKHSPDDVQLIGESLDQNKGSNDGAVLDQPCNNSKREKKSSQSTRLSVEKRDKISMDS